VSGCRQQRLLAVAAVLAVGGTGAGVAAWSRYAKLVVVQTQDKAEMRASVTRGGGGGELAVGGELGAGGRRRRDRLLPVTAGERALERTARAGTCTRLRRGKVREGDRVVLVVVVWYEERQGWRESLLQCRR